MNLPASFLISLSLFTMGCALKNVGGPPNQFVIEKPFVRDTKASEYLAGQRIHRFQPIFLNELVITANSIDGIVAYNKDSGALVWRKLIENGVEGGAELHQGRLYFGAGDGQFYALDARTGRTLWSSSIKSEGLSKPTVDGNFVYFLSGNNVARALNKDTGQLAWIYDRQDRSNFSIRGGSQPAVDGNFVYLGFSDGYLVALTKSSGQVHWESNINPNARRFKDVDASPVLDDSQIYVSSYDGSLYCLDKSNGKMIWKYDEGGYEEVALQGKVVFLSTTDGKVVALDKDSGKVHWTTQLKGNLVTAPVYTKGLLIVGEFSGGLVFLDPMKGAPIQQFNPGQGVQSKATLDAEKSQVFFMSGGANLYGLKFSWKKHLHLWPWQVSL
ncbi:PQQ-binding-like beta-propeller repeat protein [bacterium]|nr:PQQ-binding-like beta-propeller repeat protein [bacterium]